MSFTPRQNDRNKRRTNAPRRVRNGMKLRVASAESTARNWVAQRWLALINAAVSEHDCVEGLEFARSGQMTHLEIAAGRITGQVQGRAYAPVSVSIRLDTVDEATWRNVIDQISSESKITARLLTGELPEEIDTALREHNIVLAPESMQGVQIELTGDDEEADAALACIWFHVTSRLSLEPFTIFTLRGLPADQLLDRFRHARTLRSRGIANAHADPPIDPSLREPHPLESDIEEFWRPGPAWKQAQRIDPPHHAPHALLRRLGPSPLPGKFPLVGILASIYDTASQAAVRMRDEAEGLNTNDDDQESRSSKS